MNFGAGRYILYLVGHALLLGPFPCTCGRALKRKTDRQALLLFVSKNRLRSEVRRLRILGTSSLFNGDYLPSHQLHPLPMKNYRTEAEFYPYKDGLLAAFRISELVTKYVAKRQPRIVADAGLMLEIGYNYYNADEVNKWTPYDLEDYCLSHLPRKLMAGPSTFEQMGNNLVIFMRWLHAEDLVENGEELIKMMRGLPKQMAKASKRY